MIRDPPRGSPECGHDIDATIVAPGPKDDTVAVGRERWGYVVGFMGGEANRVAAAKLLHPDIEVALAASV